ncbi:structural origins of high-affinity biotin binding To Streptavidin [Cylindrobasidium torrendii FP15055 ss-10]|uniref:Structural origins of high-affinity biotin binding To Streptavidin n=1 Tax=Cylindrobasidium torrendii FP15055 ss-10 TaxID=1314674 RepID=A0A0D7B1M7_9AGAR|nr:structural origins of high-affinity biotin binding To Streptavidin [Cylindrobasidium torrendii FP15055 ss-10]
MANDTSTVVHQPTSPIAGKWHNQLGSTVIFVLDKDGTLHGKYNSSVGEAESFYFLTGRYDTAPPDGEGVTLGWTVNYRNEKHGNSHSTATWSGQYFGGAQEVIITQWLLTRSTKPQDVWESTNIGNDIFTRVKPTQEEIQKATSIGSPSAEQVLAKRK